MRYPKTGCAGRNSARECQSYAKTGRVAPVDVRPELPGQESLTRRERMELYLLTLLVQGDPVLKLPMLIDAVRVEEFYFPAVRMIVESLLLWCKTHTHYDPKAFALKLAKRIAAGI